MTRTHQHAPEHTPDTQESLLPRPDLSLRVRPADLARMLKVSKQSVSQWIKTGKVTLGPDGRLDPARACDEVMRNSDPGRLRAKVFRPLVDDVGALRRQIDLQANEMGRLRDRIAYLEDSWRETDEAAELLLDKIAAHWDALHMVSAVDIPAALQSLQEIVLLRIGGYFDDADRIEEELEQLFAAMRDIAATGNHGGAGGAPHAGETNL